jgi:hypothetical protein
LLQVVAEKLKYHRLKPDGVLVMVVPSRSSEIEGPPAKAWWCRSPKPHLASDAACGSDQSLNHRSSNTSRRFSFSSVYNELTPFAHQFRTVAPPLHFGLTAMGNHAIYES